jgi:hypothetical protein
MESQLKYSTLRGEFMAMGSGQNLGKADILLTGDNFKAEVFVPVWTSQLYVNDWWHSGTMPLSATLKRAGDGWNVSVQNLSGRAVTDARLVVEGEIFSVGEIAAGQTKAQRLAKADGKSLRGFVQERGSGYLATVQERQYAFGRRGGGRIDDLPTASMASSFIGELPVAQGGMNFVAPPGLDLSEAVAQGHAVLLAWSPGASPAPPVNQFKSKRSASNTLWRIPIAITQN